MSNASVDQQNQDLIKEAIKRLALAQRNILEAEKLKLRTKEKKEQRSNINSSSESRISTWLECDQKFRETSN